MNRPPSIVRLYVVRPDRKINLWLPLLLILPLVIVVLLILAPLLVLGAIALIAMGRGRWLLVLPAACAALCATRGLEIEVDNTSEKVQIMVK